MFFRTDSRADGHISLTGRLDMSELDQPTSYRYRCSVIQYENLIANHFLFLRQNSWNSQLWIPRTLRKRKFTESIREMFISAQSVRCFGFCGQCEGLSSEATWCVPTAPLGAILYAHCAACEIITTHCTSTLHTSVWRGGVCECINLSRLCINYGRSIQA